MGTYMALIVGGRVVSWEDGKDEKCRQKRERQKAASEESDVETKECRICEISVSHSGADEDRVLLGC